MLDRRPRKAFPGHLSEDDGETMGGSSVAVVIPQYGQSSLTQACLASLRRWEGNELPVLIVDDGSEPVHRQWWPVPSRSLNGNDGDVTSATRYISLRHRGVTAAWNAGIRLAPEAEIILLVNNDVHWQGPVISRLMECFQSPETLLVGAEWRIEKGRPATLREAWPSRRLLAGWCWAFRRSTWSALGGLDESLELYYSDTDFQLRILQAAGWPEIRPDGKCAMRVNRVPLRHAGHRSARRLPDRQAQWSRDRQRFLEKWS